MRDLMDRQIPRPRLMIGDTPQAFDRYHTEFLPGEYLRLRHVNRFWGGHWDLSLFLSGKDHSTAVLDGYFDSLLMSRIGEYFSGAFTWNGVVWEMVRTKDGKRTRRTVGNVWNAIKCIYTKTGTSTQVETAYQTNDDSIERYLRRELIIWMDNIEATQAVEEAQKVLKKSYDAWAQTVDFSSYSEDGLEIYCYGFSRLLNNLYCTETTPAGLVQVDTFVDDIWDSDISPFLTFLSLGGIDANSLQVERELRVPTRVGDLVDALARGGDNSLPYRWYIGGDLQFRFEKMSITPVMEWRGLSGGGVHLIGGSGLSWNATPGVMIDNTVPSVPSIDGSFLALRNEELIAQFSMWLGDTQPTPETEELTEETVLAYKEKYQRMITDGNFDRLHTPGSTPGFEGDR